MPDNPEHLLVCNRSPSLFIMTLSGMPVQTRTLTPTPTPNPQPSPSP